MPNRTVSKKDRPKWRFVVKRLYKEILAAADKGDALPACAKALRELYELMTYACYWEIFNAYDVFESIGISQVDFFISVIRLNRNSMDGI